MEIDQRCRAIELIICDVDGVLTDGGLIVDNRGIEIKRFNVRDGEGIRIWQKAGYHFGLVTARSSHIVKTRAAEIGVEIVRQGTRDKLAATKQILEELDLKPEQTCYMGDDLLDLAAVRHVGLGVTVADGASDLRKAADYVTELGGGKGAVREMIEYILKTQRRWDDLIQVYM
jgi:3-deoxy-D-manno-octulosonate 8-phosphate phosphatase (KDO 8-P phosphatase)